jgi:hypothetical protein
MMHDHIRVVMGWTAACFEERNLIIGQGYWQTISMMRFKHTPKIDEMFQRF